MVSVPISAFLWYLSFSAVSQLFFHDDFIVSLCVDATVSSVVIRCNRPYMCPCMCTVLIWVLMCALTCGDLVQTSRARLLTFEEEEACAAFIALPYN